MNPRGDGADPISWTAKTVTAAATTFLVGIYIYSQILKSMPAPETETMHNATNATVATTTNAFTLGAVALIVLVATVMLGMIAGNLGGGGRGREPLRGGNESNGGQPPMH